MRQLGFLITIVMLSSCHNGFHSPGENEIKEAVVNMYEKRNEADGGGGWIVKEVKVLRSWKGDDERHYNAEVVVKGTHTSPPLADRRPDEDIDETRKISLIWRGGKWTGDDE
jgi:hypothetical protein